MMERYIKKAYSPVFEYHNAAAMNGIIATRYQTESFFLNLALQ